VKYAFIENNHVIVQDAKVIVVIIVVVVGYGFYFLSSRILLES
jgi:hypothetical protein